MVRDNANDFTSNRNRSPFRCSSPTGFARIFKASITIDHGRQEATAGAESDNTFLNENFAISLPIQRSSMAHAAGLTLRRTVPTWSSQYMCRSVAATRWTSAQDSLGPLSTAAQSPSCVAAVAVARYFQTANLVMHFSYDRVFQTPSFETSCLELQRHSVAAPNNFLRLPVEPSQGDT